MGPYITTRIMDSLTSACLRVRSTMCAARVAVSVLGFDLTRIPDVSLSESTVLWSLRVLKAAHVALRVHVRWL